jgi:hypothetical protein
VTFRRRRNRRPLRLFCSVEIFLAHINTRIRCLVESSLRKPNLVLEMTVSHNFIAAHNVGVNALDSLHNCTKVRRRLSARNISASLGCVSAAAPMPTSKSSVVGKKRETYTNEATRQAGRGRFGGALADPSAVVESLGSGARSG